MTEKTSTLEKTVIIYTEPDTTFDWDAFDSDGNIPKYQEILDASDSTSPSFNPEIKDKFKSYDGSHSPSSIEKGSTVVGRVIRITDKDITLDINNKDNIIIDRKGPEERICKQLVINQEIDVLVNKVSENPFMIKGSISDLIRSKVDIKMRNFFEEKEGISAVVREMIPAGYMLDIEIDNIVIDAFMPNTLADVNKLHDPSVLVGLEVKVMLETLQQDKGIYIVSRKRYLKTLIPAKIKEISANPKDKIYTGVVTGARNFGVFVQFENCLTGMIHKANINEDYQDKIATIEPGTQIEFYVKDVIKGGSQIILTQNLDESLWDVIRVGNTLKGKVITVKPFGALIALDYETNGLIQTTYINKNKKSLTAGDKVDVVVISINRDERKIYLTFSDDTETVDRLKDKSSELDDLKKKFNSRQ